MAFLSSDSELVVSALDGRVASASGWTRANCPLCMLRRGTRDRRLSLAVSEAGWFICHRCGATGRLDRRAVGVQRRTRPAVELGCDPPEGFAPLCSPVGADSLALEPARRYLVGRGVASGIWLRAGLGATVSGPARNRIIAPVFSADGSKWLGWVGRDWTGRSLRKYLYPSGMQRAALVYCEHLLDLPTREPLLVVEGVFDALAFWGSAVALLGKPSSQQVARLSRSRRALIVALDGDAWREGEALSLRLSLRGARAVFVRLPPGEDPGSIGRERLRNAAHAALVQKEKARWSS